MLLAVLMMACGGKKEAEGEDGKKDVSELTYWDVVGMVWPNDEGDRIEWHGEEMSTEAKDDLDISQRGFCRDGDCGEKMFLANKNQEKSIEVILKAPYNIKGDEGYMARTYKLPPGGEFQIGCTHLCYDDKKYLFGREVVKAVYMEE